MMVQYGYTPLHYVCQYKLYCFIKYFNLRNNLNNKLLYIENNNSLTPKDIAKMCDFNIIF